MERQDLSENSLGAYVGFVSANGDYGLDGTDGLDGVDGSYGGGVGTAGMHATLPTRGTNAREMRVMMSSFQDSATGACGINAHCVTPSNSPAKQSWVVNQDQKILLSAVGGKGGDGGNGGRGGNGGTGMEGVPRSTVYSTHDGDTVSHTIRGTRGGAGGAGGHGGNATSGADGGSGAYVELEIEEKDMALLIAVEWDIRGGLGGIAGRNGAAGYGGSGGSGGEGTGSSGGAGNPGNARVSDGLTGNPGSGRIQVHYASTREMGARHGLYECRYYYKLISFDVVDENGDGIFEPGEHVYITNIQIQNIGGMPTPTAHSVPLLLEASDWLIPTEGRLEIPPGILESQTITLPGRLGAVIAQPTEPPPEGKPFSLVTQIRFHAEMPGINWLIRDFYGARDVMLSYPLEFVGARWTNSVLGDRQIKILWEITNKSSKPWGLNTTNPRRIATTLHNENPTGNMWLTASQGGTSHLWEIPTLEPGASCALEQVLDVPGTAGHYLHDYFKLNLCFAEPSGDSRAHSTCTSPLDGSRVIQTITPTIQHSSPFRGVNPDASILLVTNCDTTIEQLNAWDAHLSKVLEVRYDIWNVSAYGGFDISPGRSILPFYARKGIILLGNEFDFFQRGWRTACDFIHPVLAFELAKSGTHVLFAGSKTDSVQAWLENVIVPQTGHSEVAYKNKKEMIKGLQQLGILNEDRSEPLAARRLSKTKGTFEKRAEKTAKLLKTKFPMQRFQISPAQDGDEKTVLVRQGLPYSSRFLFCSQAYPNTPTVDKLDIFAAAATLPFPARLSLLWRLPPMGTEPNANVAQLRQDCVMSILYELELEIKRYLQDAPWPHRLTTSQCNQHLVKVHALLQPPTDDSTLQDHQLEYVFDIFSYLIHLVQLQTFGEKAWRWGHRRTNLRKYLLRILGLWLNVRAPGKVKECMARARKEAARKDFVDIVDRITGMAEISGETFKARWKETADDGSQVLDAAGANAKLRNYNAWVMREEADLADGRIMLSILAGPHPGLAVQAVLEGQGVPLDNEEGGMPSVPVSPMSPMPPPYPGSPIPEGGYTEVA